MSKNTLKNQLIQWIEQNINHPKLQERKEKALEVIDRDDWEILCEYSSDNWKELILDGPLGVGISIYNKIQEIKEINEFPEFDYSTYKLNFVFFEFEEGELEKELFDRDDVITEINELANERLSRQKYWPIVISTTKGMGKTFLLKKLGSQQLKSNLKCPLIQEAISCGRIITFDFIKESESLEDLEDLYSFFARLMVYHLCLLFDGTRVDGINFKKIHSFKDVGKTVGKHKSFDNWLKKWQNSQGTAFTIDEYIRLTNIAFKVNNNTPPVFFLLILGFFVG